MSSLFEYKGYVGSAEFDVESSTVHGKLLFIRDIITYSASDPKKLEAAFKEAVDDYLASCAESGDEPDKPCKGSFNVRVGPDLHKRLALEARKRGIGMNEFVCSCLEGALRIGGTVRHIHEIEMSDSAHFFTKVVTSSQPAQFGEFSETTTEH